MSDNKNINDSFERFFRKKADEYDITYKETDWKELEGRLDRLDQQRAGLLKRFLAAAAVLLIFSLLGYFIFENYLKINQLEEQLSNQQVQSLPDNSQPDAESSKESSNSKFGGTIAESDKKNEASSPSSLQKQLAKLSAVSESSTNESSSEFLVTAGETEDLFVSNLLSPENSLSGFRENNEDVVSAIEPVEPEKKRSFLALRTSKSSPAATRSDIKDSFSRFSVGFSMSPDFSTVGSFSNFNDPGFKVGASVEYNVSQSFGISAGVVYSTVRYTAGKGEYTLPYGYWTNGITPNETLARCVLIDIPINFKYNFIHFDRSRLYATAGISSYIMLNEEYSFNYDRNEPSLVQGWSGKTGTRHWMSNGSLSVGYEFDLTPALSIRAEPFIKVPLREVGWGNVKLYSTGTFISLNYNFN